jgi:hypothetical protein
VGKTVRLTDATLLSLARNIRVRKALPAFAQLHSSSGKRGCGKCGRRQPRQQGTLLKLRASIANSPAAIGKLKKLLNVDTIVVYVVENKRTVRKEL